MEAATARIPARRTLASGWRRSDRFFVAVAWATGILLCLIAGSLVIYMLFRGLQYVSLELLTTHPVADLDQSKTGGFLDPLIGTVILALLGTLIALPLGVGAAVWLTEYGRPAWLARTVESGIEMVAGTPSIVLAIFGLILFSQEILSFLSFTAAGSSQANGRSFFAAGAMMSLIALPLIFGATRASLQAIPSHVREASYALGQTKAATIRRVL